MKRLLCCALWLGLAAAWAWAGPGDVTNAQDPARLPRLPRFVIVAHDSRLGAADFHTSAQATLRREGLRTQIRYQLRDGSPPPGPARILEHYAEVARRAGGEVVHRGYTSSTPAAGRPGSRWTRPWTA